MKQERWCFALVVALAITSGGCKLRNVATDQAQIDSLTYCDLDSSGVSRGERWGRTKDENEDPKWSHFSLGEFACKTQDDWLCQARSGTLECKRENPFGASSDADVATLQRYRNETVSEMMMQSDRLCDRHLASIFGTQVYTALTTDIAGSLLSGGAAIASGMSARNLSAVAAMVGATQSHISADVYQGKVATAINLIIRKERNAARAVIRSNQNCSPSTYTASQAVQDALNYHNMCSFEYGLSELVREASDTSPLRAPLAASFLARTETELQALQQRLAALKDDDAERSALKVQIDRKRGQVELYQAFGVSDAALPVSGSGSTGSAQSPSADAGPNATGGQAKAAGGATPSATPSIEPRSCTAM